MEINLSEFRINAYSQSGEDLVIAMLLELTNTKTGYLIEAGAWNGRYLSNTRYHYEQNNDFKLLLVEPVKERYDEIDKNENTIAIHGTVDVQGENSLTNILKRNKIEDIALLSIDVDGEDLNIWNSLDKTVYRPKIVIIEFSEWYDPKSLDDLVSYFENYNLVHVTSNFIFVRSDLGVTTNQNIHELLANSGSLDYDLHVGNINKEAYNELVYIAENNLDPKIFSRLAKPQLITYTEKNV